MVKTSRPITRPSLEKPEEENVLVYHQILARIQMGKIANIVLAFLVTGFLVGDAYGEGEVYYCTETEVIGFEYDKNRGAYSQSPVKADRYKMNFDRASRTIQLSLDSLPPDAPIELSKSKFLCTWLQGFPNQLTCHQGFSHFNFNTENGWVFQYLWICILFGS